jgi:Ca2+-binding EF-hand superfamily protein
MNKLMMGTIAAAGLSIVAAGAMAGDHKGGRGYDHWEKMDANGDGEISADEINARHAAMIEAADADGNGAVSKEEMQAYREARRAEWREKHNPDKNGDGVVDKTEFLQNAQEMFDKLDENGDGVLSEDEQTRHRRHHRRGGKKGE